MATISYFKGNRCEENVFHKTVTIKLIKENKIAQKK